MMFLFYSILFAYAFVMLARSLVRLKCDDAATFVILAGYAFIGVATQLHWNDIGERAGLP